MKNALRRIAAILLTLTMMATMLPLISLTALADGTLTVSDPGIGLSWTGPSNSKGKASWSAGGTTITGTATGYLSMGIIGRTITTKLTIKNNYSDTRKLSFNYTLADGGSVSGISGNAYSGDLPAGGTLDITLTSPSGTSANTLTITNLQLIGNSNITTTFQPGENGSYTVNGTTVTTEVSYEKAPTESVYTVAATPDSGYSLYGWYNVTTDTYLSYDDTATLPLGSNCTIKPVFVSGNSAHYTVGTQRFTDFDEAIAAAQAGSTKTVVVAKDGVLTGSHTIPSGITLLVPYNLNNTAYGDNAPVSSGGLGALVGAGKRSPGCTSTDEQNVPWVEPTKYREWTLAADAHLTVNGAIEVSGQHAAAGGGGPWYGRYAGSPSGPLGFIHMQAGSHIDLNSGAKLYCWGYIYGDGTITAKNGSAIHENFQMQDFRGGTASQAVAREGKVFPNSQYYVQNIEVATTYEYGSTEYVLTSVYMLSTCNSASVKFIGDGAMFRPQPGSYVVKDYDPTTDTMLLDSYGDCTLAELSMSLASTNVNSADFVLPITNNMHIRIKSGTATLQQNVMLLPGSSLTVDQGATLNIAYTSSNKSWIKNGGYILQMFDYNNYTYGLTENTYEVVADRYYNYWDRNDSKRTRLVPFTCTERKVRTEADLVDAKLDVNGTIICNGYLYSTVDYASVKDGDYTITGGGANIYSSEGTGVIQMVNGAGKDKLGYMYDQGSSSEGDYYRIPLASVQLKNGDGTLLDTTGAVAGTVYEYCAEHDCWYTNVCCLCESHDYAETITAPDCVNGGYTTYTCRNCGDSYVGNNTAALGHSYNSVVTDPDCDNGGYTTYTCSVCGDSYVGNNTSALGHTPGEAADCENTQNCIICGFELNAALGHDWVDADCDTPKTCNTCGATEGEALGHTPGAAADCENAQTCTVCGEVLATALGHTWNDATCTAPKTCSVCDATEGDALGHTPGAAADCENDQTCTVCGDVLNAALGHKWNDATCTAPKTCSVCGATDGDALGHTPGAAADCVNDQVCTVCGEVLATALGHTWNDATCTDPKTCSVCGATEGDALGHSYTETSRTDATCGADGSVTYTCSCGDSYSEPIAATGEHIYFDDCSAICEVCGYEREAGHNVIHVEAKAATCTEMGNIEYWYCDVCGMAWLDEACTLNTNLRAVVLPMAEHTYDNDFDADCNVCGDIREVDMPITFGGRSISEDVEGLAFKFNVSVTGMAVNVTTAIYDNACIGEYKLNTMGAIMSNGYGEVDIPAVYLCNLLDKSASYSVRILELDSEFKKDCTISAKPYIVLEKDGVVITVYGETQSASYNSVLNG